MWLVTACGAAFSCHEIVVIAALEKLRALKPHAFGFPVSREFPTVIELLTLTCSSKAVIGELDSETVVGIEILLAILGIYMTRIDTAGSNPYRLAPGPAGVSAITT